tara:strand:+ start:508 stop:777 length:270 start_codon:yes stop_codon:yes gene_type:complete
METTTEQFGSLRIIEITVPTYMVACAGPWDDSAEYYGPVVAELNPDANLADIRAELGEYDMEYDWQAEPLETVWGYVAWLIACDRMDRS